MSIEVNIQLKNGDEIMRYLAQRPEKTRQALNNAIRKTVLSVQRGSQQRAPVITGRLRASIQTSQTRDLRGEVTPTVRYALFVHEPGITRRWRGRPFLRDAVRSLESKIKMFFQKAITEALK